MKFSSSKIKSLRAERGWSQEHLGEVTGLSSRTIQRLENDGSGSAESLMAIASAFSISPGELQSEHKPAIGDGKWNLGGFIGLLLIVGAVLFYLNITGEPSALIDIPALLYILLIPFAVSILSNGFGITLDVYKLFSWLVYEQNAKTDAHLYLPVLRKLIVYSYASGATGTLFSLLGMLTGSGDIYYPAGFSIALVIFIYATIQSEFLFRPLYHKLNRQLLEPGDKSLSLIQKC